jgi:hypothetical protein
MMALALSLDSLVKPVAKDELVSVMKRAVDQHVILKDQFVV